VWALQTFQQTTRTHAHTHACATQVFGTIIIVELFGSPFMRSAAIVFSLVLGTAVSAAVVIDGKRMFTGAAMRSAPAITFLWVHRFPIGEWLASYCRLGLLRVSKGSALAADRGNSRLGERTD
jgi:xanthine/uracil permease